MLKDLLNDALIQKVVSGFENGFTGLSYRVIIQILFDKKWIFRSFWNRALLYQKNVLRYTFLITLKGAIFIKDTNQFTNSNFPIDSKFLEYNKRFKYEKKIKILFDNKHLTLQFLIFFNRWWIFGKFIFFMI